MPFWDTDSRRFHDIGDIAERLLIDLLIFCSFQDLQRNTSFLSKQSFEMFGYSQRILAISRTFCHTGRKVKFLLRQEHRHPRKFITKQP
jgi:hypothetical protein